MSIEYDLKTILNNQVALSAKLDILIPEVRDVSKYLAEAKELANKGKKPRKQPKKKEQSSMPSQMSGG